MSGLVDDLAKLDHLIHEPARLAILTALSACKSADFIFMQRLTALTAGNLSGHLTKLEEAGLIWIEKRIVDKRTNTKIGLTDHGRMAIERHWKQLEQLHLHAQAQGKESE
jgi:DNA-binding MarR family transcriptional regulator